MRRAKATALLVGVALLAPSTASANVLVVGVDGAHWPVVSKLVKKGRAPALLSIAKRGFIDRSQLRYEPPATTVSAPGWATVASGVWPQKHGVIDNSDAHLKNGYVDFLALADPELETMVVGGWSSIGTIFPATDSRSITEATDWDVEDGRVTRRAVRGLRDEPDASFVYLGLPDVVGHEEGTDSRAYARSVVDTDRRLGRLLGVITKRWTVIVTTDHGKRRDGSHEGYTSAERTVWVAAQGPRVPRDTDARIVDVAPTVLHLLGVSVPADLDGRSFVRDRGHI